MKIKNLLLDAVAVALLGVVSLPFWGQEAYYHLQDFALLRYTERNVPRLMKELEEELDISYTEYPEVRLVNEWDSPEVIYSADGVYTSLNNTLAINHSLVSVSLITLLGARDQEVDKIISHELGHAYVDQRGELYGEEAWSTLEHLRALAVETENRLHLLKVVNEGLGTYFGLGDRPGLFPVVDWREAKFSSLVAYRGGYHFIKPLVKEFGMERVVDYFVTHPLPELRSLREIPEYQTHVAEELRREL